MYSRCCLVSQLGRCSGKKPCCSFLLFCGACFRVVLFSAMEKFKLKCRWLLSSIGCLGCCIEPPAIILMDEPSERLTTRGQTARNDTGLEDFWNGSTLGMDHSAAQSQRSISSIPSEPHSIASSQIGPPEFIINHGLLLWNQTRQQWIGNRKSERPQVQEPKMSRYGRYDFDNLLRTNKPFPQPIPLGEMVDFLVNIWEQDGLYD